MQGQKFYKLCFAACLTNIISFLILLFYWMSFFLSSHCILPNLCSHFLKSKFPTSGAHVLSGVLCRNAWNSAIHFFIIWFTGILANLDIQTELQDCLYEYGFKDK